jgi:hypothetical protein
MPIIAATYPQRDTTPLSCPPSSTPGPELPDAREGRGEDQIEDVAVTLGKRGGYTGEDGPKAVLKAAFKHVVIGNGGAKVNGPPQPRD